MTKSLSRPIAGNTNTTVLKLIALVFMFIDHAGKMCFGTIPELRVLGRIAFPLYCWCLVVGASYTRSFPKYLLRIAGIGLISQPLYMAALKHPWDEYNIFLTLFIALLGLWGLREKKYLSHIWAPVIALVLALLTGADYGWKGVLLVFLLYGARSSRSAIAAVMVAFCLYWGSGSTPVTDFFGLDLNVLTRSRVGSLIAPFLRLQGLALLALPLMLARIPWQVKLPRWTGYVLYPGHLLLLIGLEYAMGVTVHWYYIANAWTELMMFLASWINDMMLLWVHFVATL